MKTVYKYDLKGIREQSILMPLDAEVLCVQMQNNEPKIWALVDSENPNELVNFFIFGTGHEIKIKENLKYIGTFQTQNKIFVFHVFKEVV